MPGPAFFLSSGLPEALCILGRGDSKEKSCINVIRFAWCLLCKLPHPEPSHTDLGARNLRVFYTIPSGSVGGVGVL